MVTGLATGFDGILGLSAFDEVPVTVDPGSSTLTLGDPGRAAFRVPLEIRRQGPSTEPYAELVLPDGPSISVEVDTGSGCLILDARFLNGGDVTTLGGLEASEGIDETGHKWVRLRGALNGGIHFAAAPQSRQENPRVLFQDIIHDGLIGAEYLDGAQDARQAGRVGHLQVCEIAGPEPAKIVVLLGCGVDTGRPRWARQR